MPPDLSVRLVLGPLLWPHSSSLLAAFLFSGLRRSALTQGPIGLWHISSHFCQPLSWGCYSPSSAYPGLDREETMCSQAEDYIPPSASFSTGFSQFRSS